VNTVIPAGSGNAIDSISFVVQLARPLNRNEINALLSLESILKQHFPRFDTTNAVSMQMPSPGQLGSPSEVRMSGVLLQRFQSSGKPEWSLRVGGNDIVVTCQSYTRWRDVWGAARKWIHAAIQVISAEDNFATAIALQVVDRFERDYSDGLAYTIETVFRKNSIYLAPHAASCGPQWHVFQGWFSGINSIGDGAAKMLNVLNLTSAVSGTKLHEIIDHSMQVQLVATPPALTVLTKKWDTEESSLDVAFAELHEQNKSVLLQTLADSQLTAINLKNEDRTYS
jgi:uncharacterized protein (TIGR04255 family)